MFNPNISDLSDFSLHWASVVRENAQFILIVHIGSTLLIVYDLRDDKIVTRLDLIKTHLSAKLLRMSANIIGRS